MKLDPSILRTLSLNPSTTTVSTHGSSGFNSTAKITTTFPNSNTKKHFFMKSAPGPAAAEMFRGEHESLNAIHKIIPSLCPASLATGVSEEDGNAYLVTDFLDMSSRFSLSSSASSSSKTCKYSGQSLATKLGTLHTTPAPVPPGYNKPVFGFPVPTCCGSTPQPNTYKTSWAAFFAENRLLAMLSKCEASQGVQSEFNSLVTRTAEKVVPRLLGDEHLGGGKGVMPVVIHGDLWSGNKGRGVIGGEGVEEEVVFDPSSVYGHSEYELGIMHMFGGFSKSFFDEYHRICPKTEPVAEYTDRLKLYEL
ncbi:MAG: hypothetical protein Q9168_007730 [Polycauliona sp. 1 TL-2023]